LYSQKVIRCVDHTFDKNSLIVSIATCLVNANCDYYKYK
jgi:hypothetical protein